MSCGLLLTMSKINLFGKDGVKHVWRQPGEEYKDKCVLPTVKHGGGSVMVWGCISAAGTGELQLIGGTMNANMYCDILKQSMISSLQRLGRRVVFQHDNDQYLAKEAEGKGEGVAKHISRPKPYWQGCKRIMGEKGDKDTQPNASNRDVCDWLQYSTLQKYVNKLVVL